MATSKGGKRLAIALTGILLFAFIFINVRLTAVDTKPPTSSEWAKKSIKTAKSQIEILTETQERIEKNQQTMIANQELILRKMGLLGERLATQESRP